MASSGSESHKKRPRSDSPNTQSNNKETQLPSFDFDSIQGLSLDEFLEVFTVHQIVHFTNKNSNGKKQKSNDDATISWKEIGSIFENLKNEDKKTWCIENRGENREQELLSDLFLAPQIQNERAYCSFLVQLDKHAYQETLQRLPLPNLPFDKTWSYEPCLWIFFGRNFGRDKKCDKSPLEGRGLHTDSVSHEGTWHYQLSGVKDWFLSPSCDLIDHWKSTLSPDEYASWPWSESTKLHISCQPGDVIVVNTRLWFHRTVLPFQESPSVSYARDFRLKPPAKADEEIGAAPSDANQNANNMTNLDGLYATKGINAGTVIFTERDMPDCELHRSKKDSANCEVVELDDGTSAVVSRRDIACGEFFCVPESSSDEEDFDDDEEEEEGEEFAEDQES